MSALLPTKGNLLAAKRSLALAKTGYDLMDRKRNILIRELMGMVEEAGTVQRRIDGVFSGAYAALERAGARLGPIDAAAEAVMPDRSLEVRSRSVMGVELPRIAGDPPAPTPEYGFSATGTALDEAFLQFHSVKLLVRDMAAMENAVYRLARAIKTTQKRANALQNIVIPNLERAIRLITDALDEREREEFVRLKVTKRRKLADGRRAIL